MSVPVRKVRDTVLPAVLDDTWPKLAVFALFWVSTALLAVVLLAADPVFGSFVIGIPLLLVVLARERGLSGIPSILFGAVIVASLVPTIFLGEYRRDFDDAVLVAGIVIFVVWVSTYPIILRHMDREYIREHLSFPDDPVPDEPVVTIRLHVVRLWMSVLTILVLSATLGRALLGV
ncbi:MAG: hypothetical protein GEV28_39225 [Actinophytocola sp.]|uniref:hypothetical protein n=1 Tax=Actinophytocola sp. TaxID=1872138 RepID=UPI00132B8002|nr:hypothetical protein [Actinophytocola sp.]MPZ86084.1 hypothetical protein [Actinophytocola sp.]